MKILTSQQMKSAEEECARLGAPPSVLMENAGRAVAEDVRRVIGESFKRVLVLVGPGNNGGDGEVAARYLKGWGYDVSLLILERRPENDENLDLAKRSGVPAIQLAPEADDSVYRLVKSADIVIDAVFGTGFKVESSGKPVRPLTGNVVQAFSLVKSARDERPDLKVFAVDVPSGLDADTGAVDEGCLYADETITLGFPKVGLFNMPGSERAGRITVADIGIPRSVTVETVAELVTAREVKRLLPQRSVVANKGTFGKVMVLAGSMNYIGAAYLACSGAQRVGAGLVTLACPERLLSIMASKLTEATYLPLPGSGPVALSPEASDVVRNGLQGYHVLLIGCGMGQSQSAANVVESLLLGPARVELPCVVDADALNLLASLAQSAQVWRRLPSDVILTPHPGEMSRLTGIAVDLIQQDRISVAAKTARDFDKTVVLKGAYTVVAAPDGRVAVSPFANAALASAGTGDVLAGAIAGFVAQGLDSFEAAVAGVYIHGKAGELLAREVGDAGVIASDLLARLPMAMRDIKDG